MRSDAAVDEFAIGLEATGVSSTALERALWLLVAVVLIGDVGTTVVGLHLGLTEANPVARVAIEGYGVIGLLALKVVAVALAYGCRQLLDRAYRPVIPLGLALPWSAAVVSNVYQLSIVL